jgi:hypothetical protein
MARPTKYKKSHIKIAEHYLNECKNNRKVPFLEELASRIGVTEKTLWNWSKARQGFLLAIEKIMDHQRLTLKTLGLKSPHVITFLLEANHGMIRTERLQHTGTKEEPLTLIFTDSDTYKKHIESKKRLEALEKNRAKDQKTYQNAESVGGYDWTPYINKNSLTQQGQV